VKIPFLRAFLFLLGLTAAAHLSGCPTPGPTPTKPSAAFNATPTSGEAPLVVQFTDQSTAGSSAITAWAWNFGDDTTSTEQSPSHTYDTDGTYTVALTVSSADGSDTETKTGLITVNSGSVTDVPPTANFAVTPTSGEAPLAVQFTDTSTPGSSAITTWAWDFGDGNTSTDANPDHTYNVADTYSVSLTVTTAVGSDTETKTDIITVNVGAPTPPTADFTATPTSGDAPLTVQFVDTSASGSSVITEWLWEFGDDTTSTDRNPSHVYDTAGSYSVTLTVITADGSDEEFKSNLIAVASGSGTAPTAAFSATPLSGNAPLTVQFTDESTPGTSPITTWAWDFGDGTTSEGSSPSHIYSAAGSYTVVLTVTTLDGVDSETKADLITVDDAEVLPDTSTFDVTLAPEVLRVPEAELENVIIQWNPDEHAYLLDPDALATLGLTLDVGDPFILDGIEMGRISYIETDETGMYIETEEMPLNEIFPDGTIAWDYAVEFTEDTVKSIEIPGVGEYMVKADTPINITFEQGEFKYELAVVLKKTTADFDFTVTKGIGAGVKARFTAKGQFAQFRNKNQIEFESGQLTNFGHELKGLRGNTDLKLVMAGSGLDAIDFKIPVPIMKIPFVVGYIPATLSVGAQFVVNAVVPIEGSAQVGTSFKYDSDIGFSHNGTEVQAGGRAGTTTFGDPLHQTGAASAISANFGIGFPRVTLSIAGGTLVPWAQVAFLVGGAYTPGINPCQSADAQFIGAAGYSLGILGFELASGSTKLFEQKKPLLRAGICPPDNKVFLQDETAAWLSGEGTIVLDKPVLVEY
jgi:PKD repeat protein